MRRPFNMKFCKIFPDYICMDFTDVDTYEIHLINGFLMKIQL